ncbi:amidase [Aestuariivirga sp.]|uniref:amidase n=1 Tax=Aestuariivirga sp. TaxID=2650926 RepID=UPI0039E5A10F
MARLKLRELADDLDSGRAAARGLVEASLAAIADPGGEGARAFISLDPAGALAAADYIDGLRKAGRALSRFAGIPISVKDLFDLTGQVTTAGSMVLKGELPATADATVIARLKAQGFIVIGRTNMTEFAYSGVGLNPHYGTPRSPWDRRVGHIPGGSSAGAGVSVADGMCALGIGSDTGGSCRIPAAYCGIVGFKPSWGRMPSTGVFPLAPSLDSAGPLGHSVACCALADGIMAGEGIAPFTPREAGTLRLGVLRDFVLDGLEAPVAEAFDAALAKLGSAGVQLADVAFPELHELPSLNGKASIVAVEAYAVHRARLAQQADAYDPRVRSRLDAGANLLAADLLATIARRRELIALFARRMEGFDALLLPTTPNLPPAISALAEDRDYGRLNAVALRNTAVGNFLDSCAISIPMTRPGEPPVGLSLMAPSGRDRALLAVAAGVEGALMYQESKA